MLILPSTLGVNGSFSIGSFNAVSDSSSCVYSGNDGMTGGMGGRHGLPGGPGSGTRGARLFRDAGRRMGSK